MAAFNAAVLTEACLLQFAPEEDGEAVSVRDFAFVLQEPPGLRDRPREPAGAAAADAALVDLVVRPVQHVQRACDLRWHELYEYITVSSNSPKSEGVRLQTARSFLCQNEISEELGKGLLVYLNNLK